MQTRSQKKYENRSLFKVEIDFDEASNAWRSNKKSTGNGCYKYICAHKTKTGRSCCNERLIESDYCKTHSK